MKIWTSEHIFNHGWETLTASQWRKYPNPHNTSVLRTDVLDRKVTPDGVLETHRIITSDWALAPWVQKLIGANRVCYAHEFSRVDPEKKVMEMRTVNLTFCSVLSMIETMSYHSHPEDPSKTVLKQETSVSVQGVPLTSYMESIILNTVNKNAQKGRKAMEWVVNKVQQESELLASKIEILKKEMNELNNGINRDLVATARKSIDELQLKIIPTIQAQSSGSSSPSTPSS